jgi:electron transfer flavoprotein alpha subunit
MQYKTVIVLDTIKDVLVSQSLELIQFAKELNSGDPGAVLLILPGKAVEPAARDLRERFMLDVIALEGDDLYFPNPETLWHGLYVICRTHMPEIVCFQHNMRNCHAASALAVAMESACISAVESFARDGSGLIFNRSVFNGRITMSVAAGTKAAVVTVMPGAYPLPAEREYTGREGSVRTTEIRFDGQKCRAVSLEDKTESDVRLQEADVIISAGRGIESEENLEIIRDVVRMFPNAAIAASRPVCDLKWLPYACQVGITGKTVAPRLYVACGISGSQQHIAGMKDAQCIVAINKDPRAAIFSIADFIIIEDLAKFLRALVSRYRQRAGLTGR